MRLTDEERNLFLRYMNEHVGGKHLCPICEGKEWELSGKHYLPMLEENLLNLVKLAAQHVLPVVTLRCPNCQYIENYAWLPIQKWGEENV